MFDDEVEEKPRELAGVVEGVRHHNPEDGWTVARLRVAEGSGAETVVTVVGNLAEAREGMEVRLWGQWVTHPQWGEQFRFVRYQIEQPLTAEAIKRFLASGAVRGVGPSTAAQLVARFGEDTLRVLAEEPERLREIPGIGVRRAAGIAEAWRQQRDSDKQGMLMRLQGMGISAAHAIRIHKRYGEGAVGVVERNPYQLALEVEGIGFKTADRIARAVGTPRGSPFRLQAGIAYALQEAAQQGHCFLPRERLLSYAAQLLEVEDEEAVADAYAALLHDRWAVAERVQRPEGVEELAYLPRLWQAEEETARHLRRLREAGAGAAATADSLRRWLAGDRRVGEAALSEQQAEAVRLALTEKVVVLTGGPGVGKTTVTRAMVEVFEGSGCQVLLASPTGRAAKRLSEVTGRPARTIHRVLEVDPREWRFRRDEHRPLDGDVVIVDEASMLDIELTHALVRAIPEQARLVLVGDVDQLPSVGPGLVLRDLIESRALPVARLREIFRQDRESQIVMNAYRVNQGKYPEFHLPPRPGDDCVLVSEENAEAITREVVRLVGVELPGEGFSPQDIQVLTPMNKRDLGTVRLNRVLQGALNPPQAGKREVRRGEKAIREGDRVVQTVNNYEKEVFNGDVGTVVGIDAGASTVAVQFFDVSARYGYDELDELELAYALTVHKAQGSEYPAVVLICHTSQYVMLQRNLLYTGLTRAQRKCVLVGNRPAVWTAVRNNRIAKRYTRLRELLGGGGNDGAASDGRR
jgi:exodeoxyribonuclease V alpha subunit